MKRNSKQNKNKKEKRRVKDQVFKREERILDRKEYLLGEFIMTGGKRK